MNKLFDLLDNSIDAAMITSDVNRRYFTGFNSTAGICLITRKKVYLLVDFRYYDKAIKSVSDNCDIILLKNKKQQLSDFFANEQVKKISLEGDYVTINDYNKLIEDFPEILFETKTLSQSINILRSNKSKDEVENIIKAQRIAEKAFELTLSKIKSGMTEKEISLMLDNNMLNLGSEGTSFATIVLSGINTAMPHGEPSDKHIAEGEFILFDFGAVYKGYHSDMTRTVALGYADDEMKNIYDIVLSAQLEAIKYAHAGLSGKEIDAVARDIISKKGYGENFGHSLGHSLGLEIHEYPNCGPSFEKNLDSNTVMTIEPGIYITDKFGIRIEDMIFLEKDSNINLTKTEKNLRIIK